MGTQLSYFKLVLFVSFACASNQYTARHHLILPNKQTANSVIRCRNNSLGILNELSPNLGQSKPAGRLFAVRLFRAASTRCQQSFSSVVYASQSLLLPATPVLVAAQTFAISTVRCPYLRLMQSMEFVVKGVCWSIADICRENCFFKRNEKDLREILNT